MHIDGHGPCGAVSYDAAIDASRPRQQVWGGSALLWVFALPDIPEAESQ